PRVCDEACRQSTITLRWCPANRHRFSQRILPQIAHQTAPRTLAIGQENRRPRHDFARFRALFFDEEGARFERVELVPRAAPREDPTVSFARLTWIIVHHIRRQHSREKFYAEQAYL